MSHAQSSTRGWSWTFDIFFQTSLADCGVQNARRKLKFCIGPPVSMIYQAMVPFCSVFGRNMVNQSAHLDPAILPKLL